MTTTDKKASHRYLVSITGLEVASVWLFPRFMTLTIPALSQARVAPGNVHAETNRIDGIMHTMTAWESREDMLRYVRSGAHLEAMKNLKKVASYAKTYTYESDTIPTWPEARRLWEERGRLYIGEPKPYDLVKPKGEPADSQPSRDGSPATAASATSVAG
jgi:hypothetical protein